ncbi:UDP-3-O-(3-hydroxymyristoyl)glucosamine N-acyltransferase, partial [Francisella tularensis subsp. holarctica]|nr:UDP-3-O-(3-hydroxymyristoyl)glucosamine N-acyltransferase [Francisella tularensis subsp. holarctica]
KDHTNIGCDARIVGKAGVMLDVPAGESHMGYHAYKDSELAKQWIAIRKLPETMKNLKAIAKCLNIDR